jgi:hypothetical protein
MRISAQGTFALCPCLASSIKLNELAAIEKDQTRSILQPSPNLVNGRINLQSIKEAYANYHAREERRSER